jgi:hypothetical protein
MVQNGKLWFYFLYEPDGKMDEKVKERGWELNKKENLDKYWDTKISDFNWIETIRFKEVCKELISFVSEQSKTKPEYKTAQNHFNESKTLNDFIKNIDRQIARSTITETKYREKLNEIKEELDKKLKDIWIS